MEQFTNIAGSPFQPYVAKQIEVRKKYLSDSHQLRNNNYLLYQNNRNAWIRLTSGTNITQNHPIYKKHNKSGDELAKKYILQGGSVELDINGNIINKGGVGENKLYGNIPLNPQGIKPLPGITSINISSAGKLGTLQYADIKFICYDLEQFEIFEALYLKLGFSMILEWGHTYYLDNDNQNQLQKPSPINPFIYYSKEEIIKEIQNRRILHSGNYDAMYGTVSNFGWEFQKDGSYICNIKLVGAGDILESLKLNQAISKDTNFIQPSLSSKIENDIAGINEEDKTSLTSLIGDRDLSLFNRSLFDISQYHMQMGYEQGIMVNGVIDEGYRNILNNIFSKCPYEFIQFDENGNLKDNNLKAKRGNHYSILSDMDKLNNVPILRKTLFNVFGVMYNINDNSPSTSIDGLQPQIYITLGNMLALMTATGMIYDSNSEGKGNPYIYADFNDSLNYCSTFKGQLSLDPQICLIPRNQDSIEDPFNIGVIEDKLFDRINKNKVSKTFKRSNGVRIEITTEEKSGTTTNAYLSTTNNTVRANVMCILVNVNFITDVLRNLREKDDKGNVPYSEFLNNILSGISRSLGGFNEFRILVDDSTKSFRIIDDNRTLTTQESDDSNQYTELPIFGKNSIVYDYNFKSKIGSNLASMITIAAQANPSTLGEDSFAISNLSRGLEDRYMKYKLTSEPTINQESTTQTINDEALQSLKTHIKNIISGDGINFIINQTLIEPSNNTYREILANFRLKEEPTNRGSIIIPLDFNLSMDGLSGIIPNSAFTIPSNLLPPSYLTKDGKPKIAFILHTINQDFSNNKWITKLTGQTINIRFDKEDLTEYTPKIKLEKVNDFQPIYTLPTTSNTCTRRASSFFSPSTVNIPINYLKQSAKEIGLISPQAISSLIAIAAGETGLNPKSENHIYSESRLRQIYPNLTENQYKRATKKGISKKEFFNIVYGEYYPTRVGNRNISDGGKYYGRGYIQLTGYGNYKRYSELSGVNILSNPELVNDPIIGAKIAAIYFKDRVKANQYDSNYFEKALDAVGYNVGDIRTKKYEYYNCYITKI
jgi:predicted chitinase